MYKVCMKILKQISPINTESNQLLKSKEALGHILANQSLGFHQIPQRSELFTQSEKLSNELLKSYDQFVIVGIGGSSMGARSLVEMSFATKVHFLDNVDSAEFDHVWNNIKNNLKRTAFVVVSKSGSTIEILWNYSLLENLIKQNQLSLIDQSYFVSELVENPLSKLAKKHNRPLLEIPVDIGGRFSVLTPVGLLIAGLCGYSIQDLQKGSELAIQDQESVIQASSQYLDSFERGEDITLFWFYNSNYRWFGGWLQQLWAESLGKKVDKAGKPAPVFSTPMSAIGACDQHSILQQVVHGTKKNKFVCFYSFTSAEKSKHAVQSQVFAEVDFMNGRNYGDLIAAQSKATQKALEQNQVSSQFFQIDDQNKSMTIGFLFMYFQLIVATLGESENINPFDQPGVALGKQLTIEMLSR